MNTNEIENILQEMDARSRREDFVAPCVLKDYADRIRKEVVVAENATTTGNAAAMREAIKKAIGMILGEVITGRAKFKPVIDVLNAALAAPSKNCDRFSTAKDALKAFEDETGESMAIEFIKWLFAEAKGADNGCRE